ncbi:hypothetical protein TorRG33x02_220960 [Trema orientale]|uniref:Uncharacterized protein n=1 Tax=Trema orientale TaxID=63057 RepID=A0A2P5E9B1_TREOI|nr:hypothetical protein TorRG33x02_220960 [Trema orientale]
MSIPRIHRNAKYLGLSLFHSNHKSQDFNYILEKLQERLTGWKAKVLSRAGRLTLINSVGLAIPLYTMQSVPVPLSVCNKVDALIRKFW